MLTVTVLRDELLEGRAIATAGGAPEGDRKSTRLNSSHDQISYAVFCLKKKNIRTRFTFCSATRPPMPNTPPRPRRCRYCAHQTCRYRSISYFMICLRTNSVRSSMGVLL